MSICEGKAQGLKKVTEPIFCQRLNKTFVLLDQTAHIMPFDLVSIQIQTTITVDCMWIP